MAEIQIVYSEWKCKYGLPEFNTQCITEAGGDTDCFGYDGGDRYIDGGIRIIPFGNCVNAERIYRFKGISTKSYEMEPLEDTFNMHLNCMVVTIRGKRYYCDKVKIDGKVIYNEYDDEGDDAQP